MSPYIPVSYTHLDVYKRQVLKSPKIRAMTVSQNPAIQIPTNQWIAAYIPELTDVEATRNIEFHDMSKNTPDEYTPYDNYFYGEQTPAIIEAFNRAWLMHIHRNPHHWQYWVLINDEPKEGTILIEMPYPYIIEMICDWWAFSWIKGDLSEMFAWYKDHADYIKLHNNTRSIVEEILEMIRTKLTEVENAEN